MKNSRYLYASILITLFNFMNVPSGHAQEEKENQNWLKYKTVSEAGYASELSNQIKDVYEESGLSGLLIVSNGHILMDFGDNTRRFMTHSIRKSYLSALFGIYAEKGIIDPSKSLADLGIDDIHHLTDKEKMATITDLLSARSGVYLPSAYSPRGMEKNLPERGSHDAGTHWYYSNWDFNTLCTIFEKETGVGIFESFKKDIAIPLGMEDFRLSDGYYRIEKEKSEHPAYLFKMSGRDMARFGQLFLQNGNWNGKQIIPKDWVKKSTSIVSTDLGNFENRGGYGYLWWVTEDYFGQPMYYASGSGGHRIMIFPQEDLVIVTRVNTYEGKNVSQDMIGKIVELVFAGKSGRKLAHPQLATFNPKTATPVSIDLNMQILKKYVGDYQHPFLGIFSINIEDNRPVLKTTVGSFALIPIAENQFYPEDLVTIIEMRKSEDSEKLKKIEPVFGEQRQLLKAVFYY